MQERGFTLVELIIVVAIMAVLVSVGSLEYNKMQKKANVEREVVTIYTSLSDVRLQALYTKTPRTVTLIGSQLKIYSTDDTAVPPASTIALSYPVVMSTGDNRVVFDGSGMMNEADRSICVELPGAAESPGNTDSVVVSAARVHMGKRESGGACVPDDINQK